MAQLPPDGTWLIQQVGGEVILFNRLTLQELVRFDPSNADAAAKAQAAIHSLDELSGEQKAFGHFWSGYFHACARWVR